MRNFIIAAALLVASTGAALADASVAGDWRANVGSGVVINMNVMPDGNWSSETWHNKAVVRKMSGTYTQTHSGDRAGVLVFTPTEETKGSGEAKTETDQYELSQNGKQLKLTSEGDTMVFEKRTR